MNVKADVAGGMYGGVDEEMGNGNNISIGGGTLPHMAAQHGSEGIAKLLLARGADVDAKDNAGWTPLHKAVFGKWKGMVILLLAHGANVDAKDNLGNTPLVFANGSGFVSGFADRPVDISGDKDIAELLSQYRHKK